MSVEAISWVITKASGLPPREWQLLAILANYGDAKNLCWPSNRHLIKLTGCSKSTINRTMSGLVDKGMITRVGRAADNGARRSSVTRLNLDAECLTPVPNLAPPRPKSEPTPVPNVGLHNTKEGYESVKPKEQRAVARKGKSVDEIAETLFTPISIDDARSKLTLKEDKYGSSQLLKFWKDLHIIRGDKIFIPELTIKDRKHFNNMENKAGGRILDGMEAAVLKWDSFRVQVKSNHDKKSVPMIPKIEILLLYIGDAISLFDSINSEDTYVAPDKQNLTQVYADTQNKEEPLSNEAALDMLKDV